MKDWSSQLKDVLKRYYPPGTGCKWTYIRRSEDVQFTSCVEGVWGAGITFEELKTVLLEKELTLNNRPLTFTYDIPGNEVLTLSHLIYGRRINTISIKLAKESIRAVPTDNVHRVFKNIWFLYVCMLCFYVCFAFTFAHMHAFISNIRRARCQNIRK